MRSQGRAEERREMESRSRAEERQEMESRCGTKERSETKNRHRAEKWKRYLSTEIGIEYKACMYFFAILFFYSMYLLIHRIYAASLLHMAEIIFAAYGMGYLQVLALGNFDEAESFGGWELAFSLLCSAIYTGISYLGGWFGREWAATALFALYCMVMYLSAYLANRVKRSIDTEQLNVMLQAYQREGLDSGGDGEEDRA